MKIHQVLALAGGILLAVSTVVPSHGINMWWAFDSIGWNFVKGALPLVLCLAGVLAAVLGGWKKSSVATLLCGIVSLLWIFTVCRFHIAVFLLQPFFLLALLASVVLIAGGIVDITMKR